MSAQTHSLPEPDRLARKLFIMTVAGAFAFFMIVMLMTRYVSRDVGSPADDVAPLVRLVPQN